MCYTNNDKSAIIVETIFGKSISHTIIWLQYILSNDFAVIDIAFHGEDNNRRK
jgi:hypothetical protein